MKKKTLHALCMLMVFTCLLGSCGQNSPSSTSESDGEHTVYMGSETRVLQGGEKTTIALDCEIKNQNHITVYATTEVNLVGYIRYEAADGSGKTNEEKIFIEGGATKFSTFLDAFRVGAKGDFEKRLVSLELQNVEETVGEITVTEIQTSNRVYDQTQTLFIQDEYLKVGARLGAGGALTHVEKRNDNVVEYVDAEGNVRIENGVDKTSVKTVTDEVNLVNIHDWGREIQQSYYIMADKTHGYDPEEEVLWQFTSLIYNPVQAGSTGNKQSQIIDYEVSDSEIWVKTRPLEWFFDNRLSDSYMENRYTLQDGVLLVSNRFINFSGFTDTEKLPLRMQEMPAMYLAHPLNYFYCETTRGVIRDNKVKDTSTQRKTSADQSVEGDYHYVLSSETIPGEWVAFVNDKDFGIGLYMPNAFAYIASRNGASSNYEDESNCTVNKIHNLPQAKYYPSAYAYNYGYISPSVALTITEYTPVEYGYAIYVGEITEMRGYFTQMKRERLIDNSQFLKE